MCETATREEMEKEAQRHLELLTEKGLHGSVLDAFEKVGHDGENGLFYSESVVAKMSSPQSGEGMRYCVGVLYWLDNTGEAEKLKSIVERVESEYGVLAYMAIHGHYVYGGADLFEMLDVFVVTPDKGEWEMDREDLANGAAWCWVENMTAPDLSEFGMVPYEVASGGVVRDI